MDSGEAFVRGIALSPSPTTSTSWTARTILPAKPKRVNRKFTGTEGRKPVPDSLLKCAGIKRSEWMTVPETAARLGISEAAVYQRAAVGRIESHSVVGGVLLRK